MKNEKRVIDGYWFEDEELYNKAKNEKEGVEYLRKRTNFSNSQNILQIYQTVIEKKLFSTPVGYEFLRELQDALYENGELTDEEIAPVPVFSVKTKGQKIKNKLPKVKKRLEKTSPYKTRFLNMLAINVILVILLILFIFISNNSKNVNIINYKNRIDAEYSEKEDNLAKWAEELEFREAALNGE